jgi:hypothetical protein
MATGSAPKRARVEGEHDDTTPGFTEDAARMIEAYYSKYGKPFNPDAIPAAKIVSVLPTGRTRGAPSLASFATEDFTLGDYCIDQDIPIVTGVKVKIHACINISQLSFTAKIEVCVPFLGCSTIANCNIGAPGQRCCFGYRGIFEGCLYLDNRCLKFDLDIAGNKNTIELLCV